MNKLEEMSQFFESRLDGYDEHMLNEVEGCKEGYIKMASLIPSDSKNILDLGCGTGLELDEIFKRLPDISVTAIDLTQAMLDRLKEKHPDKNIRFLCGDYFSLPFGEGVFHCAISFETMHHFPRQKKIALYRKIASSLTPNGCYIECDYMVDTQEEENFFFSENLRLRKENNIPDGIYCHYDTPCTPENQIKMLKEAGFEKVKTIFRKGSTVMIIAENKGEIL